MDLNDLTAPLPSVHQREFARRNPEAVQQFTEKVARVAQPVAPFKQLYLACGGMEKLTHSSVLIFGADHGIASWPEMAETDLLVRDFLHESLPVNKLSERWEIPVKLVDCGFKSHYQSDIQYWIRQGSTFFTRKIVAGTSDCRYHAALTTRDFWRSVLLGKNLAQQQQEQGVQIAGITTMGAGQEADILALAIAAELIQPEENEAYWRSELGEEYFQSVVKGARRHPKTHDIPTLLTLYGGANAGVLLGFILQASHSGMGLVIDNDYALLVFCLAQRLQPHLRDYALLGYESDNPLYRALQPYAPLKTGVMGACKTNAGHNAMYSMQHIKATLELAYYSDHPD